MTAILTSTQTGHWYASSDWWLVVITALTGLAVAYQAREMTRATKAMEKNTSVVMDAERGHIVTFWDHFVHYDGSPGVPHTGGLSYHFNWNCGNAGKTPVTLLAVWSRFIAIVAITDLSTTPNYSTHKETFYIGEPLQPNAKKPQTKTFSAPLETPLSYAEMDKKVKAGRCTLYAYGYAKYQDVWGRIHQTRFGLVYDPTKNAASVNPWTESGPPQYNRST